jgi:hypothetical protein
MTIFFGGADPRAIEDRKCMKLMKTYLGNVG